MKNRHTEGHQVKIIQLQTPSKKPISTSVNKIATVLLFGFFISLSIISNQIFLEKILIATAVISLALISKKTTSTSK
ncbi:hypothetical protein ACFO3O_13940 [Dokdonia ponticola]|uniref:Uncharacterized protein n=1 Tax=Dokdonia ponticola TaxID=2041041 RepID=A0ABV9HYM6_9FLAO